jgi:hypothetical protein
MQTGVKQGGQRRLRLYPRRFSGSVRAASCITRHYAFACLSEYNTRHDFQTQSLQIPLLPDCRPAPSIGG